MTGPLAGSAEVEFPKVANDAATFTLSCNFLRRIDWHNMLLRLIEPAHAMLHVFTDSEIKATGNERFAFSRAAAGEPCFTAWQSSTGDWRAPDTWEVAKRRIYRFLPELAWANYLGQEFNERYDNEMLKKRAAIVSDRRGGTFFTVTDKFKDVVDDPVRFELARAELKVAFASDFFRVGSLG